MGVTVIHSGVFKARKTYNDDGWDMISDWDGPYGDDPKITFAEKRMLVKYTRQKGHQPNKILPGQLYERQFNNMDGDVYTWRTKKEFYDFARKFDLFPDI
jgi:hypothetical protein